MPEMIKAEFHCHTLFSSDSLTELPKLIEEARRKGLARLAVTDHSQVEGAFAAQKLAPEMIVIGEEVKTTSGEILAYYLKERLPKGISPEEAFLRLKEQGAFISLAHPFDSQREHWSEEEIERFLPYLDGIEVFNSRCIDRKANPRALAFALKYNIPQMVGSDAHVTREMGRATLTLPEFHDADSLRAAVKSARQETKLSSPFIHFTSRYAHIKKDIQNAWK